MSLWTLEYNNPTLLLIKSPESTLVIQVFLKAAHKTREERVDPLILNAIERILTGTDLIQNWTEFIVELPQNQILYTEKKDWTIVEDVRHAIQLLTQGEDETDLLGRLDISRIKYVFELKSR